MNRKEVLEKMAEICKDVFEDESLIITEELSAADVEDWDSLALPLEIRGDGRDPAGRISAGVRK